ncbi:MAG: exodeoxyribonuclease VII small subunit [Thermoleophilia bacterium]
MNDDTESTESTESVDATVDNSGLTSALSSTLDSLNQSIERMEAIVRNLQSGDSDWEESVRLLSEANELAMESSQKLDRVVQDVVYGSTGDDGQEQEQDQIPGI